MKPAATAASDGADPGAAPTEAAPTEAAPTGLTPTRPPEPDRGRPQRRWLPLLVLVLGLTSVLLLVLVDRLSDQWASQDLTVLHSMADVQNGVTAVHLWLEEYAAGDADRGDELWQDLETARTLSRALVVGSPAGTLSRNAIVPPRDPELRSRLEDLHHLVERFAVLSSLRRQFYEDGVSAGLASSTDAEYDRVFVALDELATQLQVDLADGIRTQKRRSRYLIAWILVGWLVVIVGAAAALWRYERLRAQTEAALKEREKQLLQAQKMEAVGRLAGGLAHDINNYLAAIRGQCELVKMKAGPGDSAARRMDMVLATTDRASSLIERLLTFSRPRPVQAKVLHLNDVVSNLEPMMERLIGADIQLTTRLCDGNCVVRVDPTQLEQVVVNLLINAREAMPSGGRLLLTTACRDFAENDPRRPPTVVPGTYVELAVEDSGVGIPAAIRNKIFEPFFTTKNEASGLGLPTVYGIVKQNGGSVEVDSSPGSGTTFRIYLPRQVDAGILEAPEKAADRAPQGCGERLLVVDDHDEFRESLRGLLQGLGYQVTVAEDAASAEDCWAQAEAARQPFDLLITDVVMPGRDGRQLVDHLYLDHGPLRALFVSGYTGDVALRHGVREEAVDLLRKPFSVEVLGRKVRELLDRPPGPVSTSSDDSPDEDPRHAATG